MSPTRAGRINLAIAVLIAAIQASLIAFFVMQALHGLGLIRVVLAGASSGS